MATNKENQMSIISEKDIKKAISSFKESYEELKEEYEKQNVKVEDVVNLVENFSGKSAFLASTVILSIMVAMPPKEFMALMETTKSVSKVKLLELMKEVIDEKIKGADNDIDN